METLRTRPSQVKDKLEVIGMSNGKTNKNDIWSDSKRVDGTCDTCSTWTDPISSVTGRRMLQLFIEAIFRDRAFIHITFVSSASHTTRSTGTTCNTTYTARTVYAYDVRRSICYRSIFPSCQFHFFSRSLPFAANKNKSQTFYRKINRICM